MFFILPTSDVCAHKYVLDITFAVRMHFMLFAPCLLCHAGEAENSDYYYYFIETEQENDYIIFFLLMCRNNVFAYLPLPLDIDGSKESFGMLPAAN